jgi:hypothetical protein
MLSYEGFGPIHELPTGEYANASEAVAGFGHAARELRSLARDLAPTAAAWRAAHPHPDLQPPG